MLFSSYMIHIYCLFHLSLDFLRIPISGIDINDAATLPHRLHIGVFRISAATTWAVMVLASNIFSYPERLNILCQNLRLRPWQC